ncbi:LacI family DNA-binding transcriptional regulator [Salinibacterium sp. G-O1]|uniref:LacI family DNA-binding transcriptional regulator n=1 Tax=Salinibacterium sp. G-O1 TaxID=3046208 RepID=UPI0024BAB79B|nr:LacI family DNA-binding transcriptional regulator [Salinibacterium sp. G-O1]MDJ0333884.1 LacI family DNA-binding transcriptional regulator [Salinibacterium sp. G-O1]
MEKNANASTRRVTQADVARLAGVSQATVSHVIASLESGTSRVSDKLRTKVTEAIDLTGYVVNPIAQRLAGGRSGFVGVFTYEPIFAGEADSFYHPFLVGVERAAETAGWNLVLFTGAAKTEGRRRMLADGARSLSVADGCILLGLHYDARDLEALLNERFPFVFIGARHSDAGTVPYVAPDYEPATRDVLDLMFAYGHGRIGYVGDLNPEQVNNVRLRVYRDVMRSMGDQPGVFIDSTTTPSIVLQQVLDNRLTAVVTDNTGIAGMLRAEAQERGIRVPEDLSIAQLGDAEIADEVDWTGFHIPRDELGFEAVRLLAELIDGTSSPDDLQRLFPCAVIDGTTAGPAPRTPSSETSSSRGVEL